MVSTKVFCLQWRNYMSLKKLVASFIGFSALMSTSYANELIAANETQFTQLCMTAIAGNRAAMHNSIRSSGYSKAFIVKNLQCNGENILAFVEQYGKNSDSMLRILNRNERSTSITDLAKAEVK